jgi:hypothetical protein
MKTISKYIIAAFLFALLLIGCKKDDTNNTTTPGNDPLMPLKIGNTWTYSNTEYAENGSATATSTLTLIASGQKKYFGKDYFIIANASDLTDTVFAFRSEKDKLFVPDLYSQQEATFFKLPATNEILINSSAGLDNEKVVSSSAPITINTFTGYKVTDTVSYNSDIEYYQEIIFAKGIGMIGLNDYHHNVNHTGFYKIQELKLLSYHLQ